ncbi:CDP-glycerol:poly(glycerophosphate) glycerophosphotransferase [Diaminobutyricimonas aerilata]|uniref:CDP-glycerol:poly(Glycerophosphate) glycerophosphotransferase n=1 Tax=Diaminobutyricimonas aerilata TaxID=1162967 RepID=A0A2M9CIF6_9MICO|nr:CDP-glycerol glycerophosphotransferase family protein [Diaminobutyricimonas aerilata]PJJ71649.1 CDP-glycerol:poly(glycerophosphate) glycerophosphotransferase [Diaminobutyricimonas aerilata]
MAVLDDLRSARRVLRNIVRSRRARAGVSKRLPFIRRPEPDSIRVAVYFADTRVNLYQIRQWYAPLAELSKHHPVAIITRSPGTALTLWDEAPVPVLYLRQVVELEQFVAEQNLRMVLYVNQNAKNFQMFRYGRMWHVFINHGESDKMYMTTNQFKAYDYALVAGDAARDRLRRALWDYDVETRTLPIGRPQADHFAGELPYEPDDRTVVLYAPTWEGDRAAAAYGSIATHGTALVDALLATGRHRVIYRPHPRSGVLDPEYKAANAAIIAALEAANAADPAAHHVYDDGPTLGWQLAAADVAITDISAMVYDRLAVGRPLIVTRPSSPHAAIDHGGYLGEAEWLRADDARAIVPLVDRVLTSEEAQRKLEFWVHRYFGDTTPGAATARFHAAIDELSARWEEHAALHRDDPRHDERDPFAYEDDEDAPVEQD